MKKMRVVSKNNDIISKIQPKSSFLFLIYKMGILSTDTEKINKNMDKAAETCETGV
jgi:hypothetical protein